MESYRDSIKATSKWFKTQIQKGASPEKAARNGYDETCDYLDILDNRIHIQQRALACQSKALSHILQREMYTMGNSVLIRWEVEMTHPQSNLGDTRYQQLRSSPFSPFHLFHSQLVKEAEELLLKKGTVKIKISPFMSPLQQKERLQQETSLWGTIHSNQ